ncbi:pyridoxamine 5'-phosphate oxidase family protein [Paradesulfitobacterium ferrireducens]|uniref:pyridoxamine 5'-phosphate oxidase family protein n=1 Tax=Paradesulfitobacterium ferrireducens TaxID=2816476 RepID=UPI001A8D3574|nr:pyridoxamine 5'-phosphate oxidase family protein [Paradesulfitobacterium ferrireducens]
MIKSLRREDRKIDEAVATVILEQGEYGILSIASPSGNAYGVPLSYVYMNGSIYLHGASEGHKHEIIEENNGVSFCVVGEAEPLPEQFSMKYQSVIVFGNIVEVYGDEKHEALLGFVEKYASQYIEKGKKYVESSEHKAKVIKINIEHMSGKARK